MAFRELPVVEIKEILRRWSRGDSLRTVAAGVAADRKTVRAYVRAARNLGFARGDAVRDELVAQLVAEIRPGRPVEVGAMRKLCRDHRHRIEGWMKDGCKAPRIAILLHRHSGVTVPVRTLRRFIAEELGNTRRTGTVRVVDPEPGKVLEIDFMEISSVFLGGTKVKLYALVCVAVVSRHLFVWPCLSMTQQDWVEGLEAAWDYFDGVFPVVVADNPKAIVAKADAVAPVINERFAEYSQARGFILDLARVRRPQDKPRVERAVPYVREHAFAGERFVDLEEARRRVRVWCAEIAGARKHGTTRRQPRHAFVELEQPLLLPAPTEPYDPPEWVDVTVGRDHAVHVAKALYSVPHRLRGERLRVRITRKQLTFFHRAVVVKVHPRVSPGESQIDGGDLPPGKAELATRDAEALHAKAMREGPSIGEYVRQLLDTPAPWMRMRFVYRLLGLCRSYGPERVEAACKKALDVDVVDVQRIVRMLERGLEGTPAPKPPTPRGKVLRPRFSRNPSEFSVRGSHE